VARPKRHLAVLVSEDDIAKGREREGPPRPDLRAWRDEIGNWWWPKPWHLIAAQVAVWVGWTTPETMRAPMGVLGHIYAAHQRSDDDE
jgi:hypothetical protein